MFSALCLRVNVGGDTPSDVRTFGFMLVILSLATPAVVAVKSVMGAYAHEDKTIGKMHRIMILVRKHTSHETQKCARISPT